MTGVFQEWRWAQWHVLCLLHDNGDDWAPQHGGCLLRCQDSPQLQDQHGGDHGNVLDGQLVKLHYYSG